jgi:hypothetical protein
MFTTRATLGLMLTLALSLVFAVPASAGGLLIKGKVLGTDGQLETPLEYVKVLITPLGPLKGKKVAPAEDLVGVQITNPTGSFTIAELSSPSLGKEFPLLKNWRYAVKIEAAGHYIFAQEIEIKGKAEPLDFLVISREFQVVDDSGGVKQDNRGWAGGQVRSGT